MNCSNFCLNIFLKKNNACFLFTLTRTISYKQLQEEVISLKKLNSFIDQSNLNFVSKSNNDTTEPSLPLNTELQNEMNKNKYSVKYKLFKKKNWDHIQNYQKKYYINDPYQPFNGEFKSCDCLINQMIIGGKGNIQDEALWNNYTKHVLYMLPYFTSMEIASVLHAYGRVRYRDPLICEALFEALYWKSKMRKVTPNVLCFALEAATHLRYCPSERHLEQLLKWVMTLTYKKKATDLLKIQYFISCAKNDFKKELRHLYFHPTYLSKTTSTILSHKLNTSMLYKGLHNTELIQSLNTTQHILFPTIHSAQLIHRLKQLMDIIIGGIGSFNIEDILLVFEICHLEHFTQKTLYDSIYQGILRNYKCLTAELFRQFMYLCCKKETPILSNQIYEIFHLYLEHHGTNVTPQDITSILKITHSFQYKDALLLSFMSQYIQLNLSHFTSFELSSCLLSFKHLHFFPQTLLQMLLYHSITPDVLHLLDYASLAHSLQECSDVHKKHHPVVPPTSKRPISRNDFKGFPLDNQTIQQNRLYRHLKNIDWDTDIHILKKHKQQISHHSSHPLSTHPIPPVFTFRSGPNQSFINNTLDTKTSSIVIDSAPKNSFQQTDTPPEVLMNPIPFCALKQTEWMSLQHDKYRSCTNIINPMVAASILNLMSIVPKDALEHYSNIISLTASMFASKILYTSSTNSISQEPLLTHQKIYNSQSVPTQHSDMMSQSMNTTQKKTQNSIFDMIEDIQTHTTQHQSSLSSISHSETDTPSYNTPLVNYPIPIQLYTHLSLKHAISKDWKSFQFKNFKLCIIPTPNNIQTSMSLKQHSGARLLPLSTNMLSMTRRPLLNDVDNKPQIKQPFEFIDIAGGAIPLSTLLTKLNSRVANVPSFIPSSAQIERIPSLIESQLRQWFKLFGTQGHPGIFRLLRRFARQGKQFPKLQNTHLSLQLPISLSEIKEKRYDWKIKRKRYTQKDIDLVCQRVQHYGSRQFSSSLHYIHSLIRCRWSFLNSYRQIAKHWDIWTEQSFTEQSNYSLPFSFIPPQLKILLDTLNQEEVIHNHSMVCVELHLSKDLQQLWKFWETICPNDQTHQHIHTDQSYHVLFKPKFLDIDNDLFYFDRVPFIVPSPRIHQDKLYYRERFFFIKQAIQSVNDYKRRVSIFQELHHLSPKHIIQSSTQQGNNDNPQDIHDDKIIQSKQQHISQKTNTIVPKQQLPVRHDTASTKESLYNIHENEKSYCLSTDLSYHSIQQQEHQHIATNDLINILSMFETVNIPTDIQRTILEFFAYSLLKTEKMTQCGIQCLINAPLMKDLFDQTTVDIDTQLVSFCAMCHKLSQCIMKDFIHTYYIKRLLYMSCHTHYPLIFKLIKSYETSVISVHTSSVLFNNVAKSAILCIFCLGQSINKMDNSALPKLDHYIQEYNSFIETIINYFQHHSAVVTYLSTDTILYILTILLNMEHASFNQSLLRMQDVYDILLFYGIHLLHRLEIQYKNVHQNQLSGVQTSTIMDIITHLKKVKHVLNSQHKQFMYTHEMTTHLISFETRLNHIYKLLRIPKTQQF